LPFIVIGGTFHLIGRSHAGNETGFAPDGDSMHFAPDDRLLLHRLERLDQPVRLSAIGSTQLRFEGIDALELHYKPSKGGGSELHQPRPLADEARDFLTHELGMDPVAYVPPKNLRVRPPQARDAIPGFVLSRALDVHGRPVSFVFAGAPPAADGSDLVLDTPLLEQSLNFRSLAAGQSYPLFYDTLFAELRSHLADAAVAARGEGRGLWSQDGSQTGIPAATPDDLEQHAVTFPKLFRRLVDFLAQPQHDLADFLPWLAATKEQVLDTRTTNFTHFDNVVTVGDAGVALARLPEELVFVSAKAASPAVAPWVALGDHPELTADAARA
jgi:endonuclease YncB( thermonuclease family)